MEADGDRRIFILLHFDTKAKTETDLAIAQRIVVDVQHLASRHADQGNLDAHAATVSSCGWDGAVKAEANSLGPIQPHDRDTQTAIRDERMVRCDVAPTAGWCGPIDPQLHWS